MKADIHRYIIKSHGPDHEDIKMAFRCAFQICLNEGISEITLLVPAKKAFLKTVVGMFLGRDVSKALCNRQKVKVTDNPYMILESQRTFESYRPYGMLIGVCLSQKGQNLLDSVNSAKAIVLLPWTEEGGKNWMSTWNPTVLGKSTWQVIQPALDAEVEEELQRLTRVINLSTGLTHPYDRQTAHETLSRLKKKVYRPNPDNIRKWAVRHDWVPKDAENLEKLAGRYFKN